MVSQQVGNFIIVDKLPLQEFSEAMLAQRDNSPQEENLEDLQQAQKLNFVFNDPPIKITQRENSEPMVLHFMERAKDEKHKAKFLKFEPYHMIVEATLWLGFV